MRTAILDNDEQLVIDDTQISDVVFEQGGILSGYTLEPIDDVLDYLIALDGSTHLSDEEKVLLNNSVEFLESLDLLSESFVFVDNSYESIISSINNQFKWDSICNEYLTAHTEVVNSTHKFIVSDIEWDFDEDVYLPTEMEVFVPYGLSDEELDEFVSDTITEMMGYCHKGFSLESA